MAEQGFTLTSPAFRSNGNIPAAYTCEGENSSPELLWLHPPEGTRSFVLILDDPDAPRGTFTHWLLFDIPATQSSLPAGVKQIGIAGTNDFRQPGYGGPCPPPNHGEHRYRFKLFALSTKTLNLKPGCSRKELEASLQPHILDRTELVGRFERTSG